MSIEKTFQDLTAAILELTFAIKESKQTVVVEQVPAQAAPVIVPQVPATPAPAPSLFQEQAPVQAAPVVQPMPAVPQFTPVAQPQVAPSAPCPFDSIAGLVKYATESYMSMGATKGAGIQGVITNLGYSNINDIKPEHFSQFHQAVELLKVS